MNSFQTFKDLNLPSPLARALDEMEFIEPTPVQAEAIPQALKGQDILGTAQTGTGKTAAFGIPLLVKLHAEHGMDGLILAPTRELAAQIHQVLTQMSRGSKIEGALVVGGESFGRQVSDLQRHPAYIVATPGRLNDHLMERTIDLSRIGFLVLDEVDRMLDMGFAPQIQRIMRHIPKKRQTMLFSATLPREILNLAHSLLKSPVRVEIGAHSTPVAQITESTILTTQEGKNSILLAELKAREGKVLVFTRTKSRTDRVARFLHVNGFKVVGLHGGKSQGQRKLALERFRSGKTRIMVATDLAGRGIDVLDIEHVINYDIPGSREDYIHRIGRTGRWGKTGNAVNLLVNGDYEGELIISGKKPTPRVVFRSRRFGRGRR